MDLTKPENSEFHPQEEKKIETNQEELEKIRKKERGLQKKAEIEAMLKAKKEKLTQTPFNKLISPNPQKKNICLLLTGSFYPIHNNHIRMLTKVKEYFTKNIADTHIVGSYIMPSHTSSLRKKLRALNIDSKKRVELLQAAVEEYDDIMVDPYLISQQTNIGMQNSTARLEEEVKKHFSNKIDEDSPHQVKVLQIFGTDNIPLVEHKLHKGVWIFVHNRPNMTEFKLDEWLASEKGKKVADNLILVRDEDNSDEISSTVIRQKYNLGENVEKYLPKGLNSWHSSNPKFKYVEYTEPTEEEKKKEEYGIGPLEDHINFKCEKIKFEELEQEYKNEKPWRLGQGLQAKVWAMKYKGIPVAVKIFDFKQKIQVKKRLAAFTRELQCLTRLNHKNMIKCYGAGSFQMQLYIVLERATPVNIWTYLDNQRKTWDQSKPMPFEWVKAWAELAEGCHEMTKNQVLHRDLQLDNILLFLEPYDKQDEAIVEKANDPEQYKYKKVIKLTDFGCSCVEEDKDKAMRGSLRHYSPEANASLSNYVSASDVFSFAFLMHEMMHGKRIYGKQTTVEQVIEFTAKGERPPFEVPYYDEVKQVMEKIWVEDASKRPSFLDISKMLNVAYDSIKARVESQ